MSVTYLRTSSQVPTPLAPSTLAIGAGASGPFSTGMTVGVSQTLNQQAAALKLLQQMGGGGYGVVSGLDLSSVSGLNVGLSAGIAYLDGPLELVGASPFGPLQVLLPTPLTLPDSSVSFVWLTAVGGLVSAITTATPPMAKLFLGTVTTSGGAITGIDYSGRVSLKGGWFSRQTADALVPTDAPPAPLLTKTLFGNFLWDGLSHKALIDPTAQAITPFRVQTLSADYTVLPTDPNILVLNPGGSNRNITLPDPSTLTPGHSFTIQNPDGATGNLVIKNIGGSTLATVSAAYQASCSVIISSSGSAILPVSLAVTSQT